jgi:hypothetical protein
MLVIENVVDDENNSVVDPPIVSYLNFMQAASCLLSTNAASYISARIHRTFNYLTFERDLEVRPDSRHWLNDDSFLKKYRVTRDQLDLITNPIKNLSGFTATVRGSLQIPVKYQLMIFLYFVSHKSTTDCIQREVFLVSRGLTSRNYVIKAPIFLRDEYYHRLDADQRKLTSARCSKKYGLLNIVYVMHGTLFGLAFTPQCNACSDYHGWKYQHLLTVLVMKKNKKDIVYYLAGSPPPPHKNCVWKHTPH